jgi:hypothetical protein|tara:strand:- start:113 stop:241 length:129 start_codon:yes stop_codon:yes gene_type:complete
LLVPRAGRILSYGSYIDREFAKADKDLSGALDFEEFFSIFSM